MIYIFHVDTGTMLSVDMNFALEDANAMKDAIKRITGIPVDKQVLLASGGESLEPNIRVCSYSAGTDTNPIYLFSKEAIDDTTPPTASVDHFPNADLKEEVDSSLNLPPTIQTVNVRCQLAQQICEKAKHLRRICEKLVHEQHLQQQGWAAVIANLEDVTADFSNRCATFESSYKQYLETRQEYLEMLDGFSNDIGMLSQIPLLPALLDVECEMLSLEMDGEEAEVAAKESSNAAVKETTLDIVQETSEEPAEDSSEKTAQEAECGEQKEAKPRTLLDWISEKDSQYRVDQVAEFCRKGLEQFDESVLEEVKREVKATLELANKCEYREIKGLEDRLYGLDQLKIETAKVYQEQTDLAQAFIHNQLRANNLGDTSILPDLCASHKRQLVVMLKNHNHLRDIKRRCLKAKQELVTNLHHRLKWVMFSECRINEMEMKLMMYRECMKRLRKQLTVLQQLHMAPSIYMTAVSEVVRRRSFSQAFLVSANDLACQLCAIYSEEVARRKNFHSQFDGHFLAQLFPGLEDMPPSFATQPPQPFDDFLPKLNIEDIETLKTQLPKLALLLSVPDTTSITQFFLSRSSTNLKPEPSNPSASIEDRIVEAVTAAGLSSNLDPALLQPAAECSQSMAQSATTTQPISSDRGFESETDTEEFEKVGQSPSDIHFDRQRESITHHDKEEAVPGQDEEIGAEANELQSRLDRMGSTVGEAMADLKTDVGQLKQWILCERTELECLISQIQDAWTQQHDSLRKEIEEKERALEKLSQSRERLKKELNSLREEKKAFEVAKESKVTTGASKKSEGDKKPRHTTRSVSESHLGSSVGPRLELKDHDEIVAQLKEQLTLECERAVAEERMRCEARLRQQLTQTLIKADADKQALFNESIRRLYDKKFETGRSLSQDFDLNRSDIFGDISLFSDSKVDVPTTKEVSEEKTILAKSDVAKSTVSTSSPKSGHKDVSPSSSIVTIESNQSLVRDAATSPEPSPRKCRVSKEKLSESTNSLIQQGKISVGSCNEGDIVLVIWDENFGTYTILQETSSYTYFLHLDSLCSLGLRANPRKQYVIGEVFNKEFCQAKKAENRYNVPVGSRFYRVRVRPLQVKSHVTTQHVHGSTT